MKKVRKHVRLTGFALACASAILSAAASPSLAGEPKRPMIVAHRGGAALLPENTFPAFDNAIRLGVGMLEFDMVMTADDQIIIQHDTTVPVEFCSVEAGSDVKPGPVRQLTAAQLQQFDCGSKTRSNYPDQRAVPGTRMPTLEAFFTRYKDSRQHFFGEIKMPRPGEGDVDPVMFTKLVDTAVRKYGLEDRFILQSSDWRTIDAMHEINPKIRTCLLRVWNAKKDYLKVAQEHHAMCMLLRLQDADAVEVKRLRDAGVTIYSEVIDDDNSWRAYHARGDDALFTNDPAGLISFLKRNPKRP